jgi:hypothetical protein
VALNAGLIFYPSWLPTIDLVLRPAKAAAASAEGGGGGGCPLLVSTWAQPEGLGTRQLLLDSGGSPLPGYDLQVRLRVGDERGMSRFRHD